MIKINKKTIAREIILIASISVILLLTFIGFLTYNASTNSKIKSTENEMNLNEAKISKLIEANSQIDSLIYTDSNYCYVLWYSMREYSESKFNMDSLTFYNGLLDSTYYNKVYFFLVPTNIISDSYEVYKNKIKLSVAHNLILKNRLDLKMKLITFWKNVEEVERIKMENKTKLNLLKIIKQKFISNKEKKKMLSDLFWIIIIIAYPFRLMIIATIWSYNILKQQN
jgi:hypothetical protein